MKNVKKVIENYHKLTARKGARFGELYASEIYELYNIASAGGSGVDLYKLTGNAFEYGFMRGYMTARNEAKKKPAGKTCEAPDGHKTTTHNG